MHLMKAMLSNIYFIMEEQEDKMYDYLIVGAGLFGATFAQLARENGKRCLILDKRENIGGNIYTEKIEGITVHRYGAHIFHTSNKGVYDYVNRFAEFRPFVNSPLAIYKDEMYNLPFNMNTFYQLWGVKTPKEAKDKLVEQTSRYKDIAPKNLMEQALKMVGDDIFNKLIKDYTKKQWGRDCTELDASIIKRLPIRYTYDNNYFNDIYQGVTDYTKLIEGLIGESDIKLATEAKRDSKYFKLAQKVIYTGAIDEFYNYSLGSLEYRSLRFENEILDMENYQGNPVVNYTSLDKSYTRCIEHKHFLNEKAKKTVITYEYPDEFCKGKEAYYPINNDRNKKLYKEYKKLARADKNIVFGGRLGLYEYLDMDKVILKVRDLAIQEGLSLPDSLIEVEEG